MRSQAGKYVCCAHIWIVILGQHWYFYISVYVNVPSKYSIYRVYIQRTYRHSVPSRAIDRLPLKKSLALQGPEGTGRPFLHPVSWPPSYRQQSKTAIQSRLLKSVNAVGEYIPYKVHVQILSGWLKALQVLNCGLICSQLIHGWPRNKCSTAINMATIRRWQDKRKMTRQREKKQQRPWRCA